MGLLVSVEGESRAETRRKKREYVRGETGADVHCIPADKLLGTPLAVADSAGVAVVPAGVDPGFAAPFTRCNVCPFYVLSVTNFIQSPKRRHT
jgi:hypothetical protein